MREILFRGKAIKQNDGVTTEKPIKENIWVYSNLTVGKIEGYKSDMIGNKHEIYLINSETVGQYTGLTDKNGKKIFEGDIVRYNQTDGAKWKGKTIICTGNVVYNAKTASFAIDSIDEIGSKNYDYFPIKNIEVIGNKWDNPELLKGGEE